MSETDAPGFLEPIFFPYASAEQRTAAGGDARFVHYTTAEAAKSIIQNRQVWMRNSTTMNDYSEIRHGAEALASAYNGATGADFKANLEALFPGICGRIEQNYNGWHEHFKLNTYIACLSRHQPHEDKLGRLSMWRAYCACSGVALIVKGDPFIARSDALKAYTTPVAYLDHAGFDREFAAIATAIKQNAELLKNAGEEAVFANVVAMFRFAIIGTKHPGFAEELEWRVITTPAYDKSERLVSEIETIRGVPQTVMKIPLQNVPEEGLVGIEIPDFLDHVIIGPSPYPWALWEAFVRLLKDAGIPNPESRVTVSQIPLRT
ncbi:MAG TPA: DUF2971 domain-containing protein [Caulobacterales bacterium]|nr:DUF2971 domain-containing protein [Caulobacterales bacterium]